MDLPELAAEHLRVLHLGGYWRGENDVVRQMMLGLRQTGAEVVEFNTDRERGALDTEGRVYDRGTNGPVWLRWEAVEPTITAFDPHLVVCNAGGLSFRPIDAARLRSRRCLVGVALSDPDVLEATTRGIAPLFDRFLTLSPECLPHYRDVGARPLLLRLATNPEYYRRVPPRHEFTCDVLMIGRAHRDRVDPVRALTREFDVHVRGEGWSEVGLPSRSMVFGEDLLAALSSAKTTLVFHHTAAGFSLVKVQTFDFIAAGALVLASRHEELSKYLVLGEELLVFDGIDDLKRLVRRCLSDPGFSQRMRDAGRRRVVVEHTWMSVWGEILAKLARPYSSESAPAQVDSDGANGRSP